LQVTYNHHPLYTFVKDTKKGQTNGEALNVFGAKWYAISAAGAKVMKKTANRAATTTDTRNSTRAGRGPPQTAVLSCARRNSRPRDRTSRGAVRAGWFANLLPTEP
jgi:Secreted repeat of unknown function